MIPDDVRVVCYCFGETEAGIGREIATTGGTRAVERVRTGIAEGRCACETLNPSRRCCLGELTRAVDRAMTAARTRKINDDAPR